MKTIRIELKDIRAIKILLNLEELSLIKMMEEESVIEELKEASLAEKYRGKLPTEVGEAMQKYITKSRSEWEKDI